ncbi:MAG: FMN-binding protein [bacterium]|jgi:Na+-transporting NADH:ubiquinone oxidoreductase subunit C|nr:FMN-binding protein [bacterium]
MSEKRKNNNVKSLLFILVLGSISTMLLLGLKNYTLPIIQRNEEVTLKTTVLEAAGVLCKEHELDSVFQKSIQKLESQGFTYYISPEKNYIFIFEGRGLWGMIKGVITLRPDLETIESVRIVAQEETPGLGGRISEEGFLNQFRRKKAAPHLVVTLRKKASERNEIDAISGASMTTQVLIDMINDSIASFRIVIKNDRKKG